MSGEKVEVLKGPLIQVNFHHIPNNRERVVLHGLWLMIWMGVVLIYAIGFPQYLGFEQTLLLGLGIIVLQLSGYRFETSVRHRHE